MNEVYLYHWQEKVFDFLLPRALHKTKKSCVTKAKLPKMNEKIVFQSFRLQFNLYGSLNTTKQR